MDWEWDEETGSYLAGWPSLGAGVKFELGGWFAKVVTATGVDCFGPFPTPEDANRREEEELFRVDPWLEESIAYAR